MDIRWTPPGSSGSESREGATPIEGAPSAALDLIVT
jgi:hypothetical protein